LLKHNIRLAGEDSWKEELSPIRRAQQINANPRLTWSLFPGDHIVLLQHLLGSIAEGGFALVQQMDKHTHVLLVNV